MVTPLYSIITSNVDVFEKRHCLMHFETWLDDLTKTPALAIFLPTRCVKTCDGCNNSRALAVDSRLHDTHSVYMPFWRPNSRGTLCSETKRCLLRHTWRYFNTKIQCVAYMHDYTEFVVRINQTSIVIRGDVRFCQASWVGCRNKYQYTAKHVRTAAFWVITEMTSHSKS